jgi:hypothetical protein
MKLVGAAAGGFVGVGGVVGGGLAGATTGSGFCACAEAAPASSKSEVAAKPANRALRRGCSALMEVAPG